MKKIMLLMLFSMLLLSFAFLGNAFPNSKSNSIDTSTLPYIHTKAMCDETNYCQDYEIECKGKEAVKISPVTGAFIQQSWEWQDSRDEKTKNNLCLRT
jgi:hypothetical protein